VKKRLVWVSGFITFFEESPRGKGETHEESFEFGNPLSLLETVRICCNSHRSRLCVAESYRSLLLGRGGTPRLAATPDAAHIFQHEETRSYKQLIIPDQPLTKWTSNSLPYQEGNYSWRLLRHAGGKNETSAALLISVITNELLSAMGHSINCKYTLFLFAQVMTPKHVACTRGAGPPRVKKLHVALAVVLLGGILFTHLTPCSFHVQVFFHWLIISKGC